MLSKVLVNIKQSSLLAMVLLITACGGGGTSTGNTDDPVNPAIEAPEKEVSLPDTSTSEALISSYMSLNYELSISDIEAAEEAALRQAGCFRCGNAILAFFGVFEDKVTEFVLALEDYIKTVSGVHPINAEKLVDQLNASEEAWKQLIILHSPELDSIGSPTAVNQTKDAAIAYTENYYQNLKLRLSAIAIIAVPQ